MMLDTEDDAARGCVVGCLLSSALWAVLFIVLWAVKHVVVTW